MKPLRDIVEIRDIGGLKGVGSKLELKRSWETYTKNLQKKANKSKSQSDKDYDAYSKRMSKGKGVY